MKQLLRRYWFHLAAMLVSSAWLIAFPLWSQWITADPLNLPLPLSTASKVQTEIEVRMQETYSLHFLFSRNGIPFEELKSSIGAMGVCHAGEECSKGIPVPIRWSIKPIGADKPLLQGEVISQDSSGWSQAHVYRSIATVRLPPGRYLFTARLLRPVPELARIDAAIAMELQPKSSSTWQLGLVWWGAVVQYVVALPVAVYAAIVLLWRAIANTTAKFKTPHEQ